MVTENRLTELRWYIIQAHPRQEDRVDKNVRLLGIETLNPKIKKPRYNEFTGRAIYVTRPLFPSYILARFRMNDSYHKIRFTRGVYCLVSFNHYPEPVGDDTVGVIQSRIGIDGFVAIRTPSEKREQFCAGEAVIVKDGMLRNFAGIFEREMPDSDRVRILLDAVKYQAHLEVSSNVVRRRHNEAGSASADFA